MYRMKGRTACSTGRGRCSDCWDKTHSLQLGDAGPTCDDCAVGPHYSTHCSLFWASIFSHLVSVLSTAILAILGAISVLGPKMSVPSKSDSLQAVYQRGTYYNPAWTRYGNDKAVIVCDRCGREGLRVCVGLDTTDLCMACVGALEAADVPTVSPFYICAVKFGACVLCCRTGRDFVRPSPMLHLRL